MTGWRVRVPASSANLGCAFDCAALALDLHLEISCRPGPGPGIQVLWDGSRAQLIPEGHDNLLAVAMETYFREAGLPNPSLEVRAQSEIPVGAGLGSSAAAVVGGLILAGRVAKRELLPSRLLWIASELEGHADNVAAALHGGLVVSLGDRERQEVSTARTRLADSISLLALVSEASLATRKARRVLPDAYSRGDVVHNLQRAAMLVATVFSGGGELCPEWFDDRFHQPYRSALVPGLSEALSVRHPDLLGVWLSGAGPSVLAAARRPSTELEAMLRRGFEASGQAVETIWLRPDNLGAQVEPL